MWTVTRQYITGKSAYSVEISRGDLNGANPGFIGAVYSNPSLMFTGEGITYSSAVEAAKVAIAIRDAWEKAIRETVLIGMGNTLKGTVPLAPKSPKQILAKAQMLDAIAKKCGCCGEVLPLFKDLFRLTDSYFDDIYCSEACALRAWDLEKEGEYPLDDEEELMQEYSDEILVEF